MQRNALIKRLRNTITTQVKYYNEKHLSQSYIVRQLIIFSIKNFKQKRSSKKLTHKFVKFFRIENKINAQTYRLRLSSTYRIHNIFHVFLLKFYHYKANSKQTNIFMQISKLIDDKEM